MRIDTTIIPKDHKLEPFTRAGLNGGPIMALLRQLASEGLDLKAAIAKIEEAAGGKALTVPMDLADCLSFCVEVSKEYSGEDAAPKMLRAKILRVLCGEGEIEIADDHFAILQHDVKGPRVAGAMMLFLDEMLTAIKAAHEAEDARARAAKAEAAKLVAVEEKTG